MRSIRQNISSNVSLRLVLALSLLWLSGCAGRKEKEVVGPQPLPPDKEQAEAPVPEPIKKRIALALGGAGVASFATVGFLKKLKEEGIEIDYIVTTGWPSLFALGHGYFKSIHDLEWFAMRLQEKDFFSSNLFDFNKGYASHDRLKATVEKAFKQTSLGQTSVPIVISATNLRKEEPDVYSSGGWLDPLLKAMSVPGIYRPFPENASSASVQSTKGIDVEEAVRRKADVVVAVSMYDDYINFYSQLGDQGEKGSSESVFRRLYLTRLGNNVRKQVGLAQFSSRIVLKRKPTDFAARREAIHAGYTEAARLVRDLRAKLME